MIDPVQQQRRAAKQQRQAARVTAAPQQPAAQVTATPQVPAPQPAPPPAAPPPAAPPPAAPPPQAGPGRDPAGGPGGPYGYQGATAYGAQQQEPGTAYEQSVLGGQYLGKNPFLDEYVSGIGDQFQRNLGRTLSQVSSPFLSGATMGQSGIHGNTRGIAGTEALNDFQTGVNKIYMDEWGRERGFQQDTSQDIGQRTMNLRDQASRNYGTDVAAQTQIRTAKIAANSALQQARMAQALGYDQLAGDMMLEYERLNQQAVGMEQDWILRSGGQQADIMRNFSETQGYGQPVSSTDAITQGIIGGTLGGIGAVGSKNIYLGERRGPG